MTTAKAVKEPFSGEADDGGHGSAHVAKILRTLEILAHSPSTAAEITAALGVHPRTVGRLLESLVAEGYVSEYGTDRRKIYTLTLRIVSLGWQVMSRTDLVTIARPYVTRLCATLSETCHICVPGEDFVVDLIQEVVDRPVAVKPVPGAQVPYHCTAIGKAMLAYFAGKLERMLRGTLKRYTEYTIVDPADLMVELGKVRKQGFALDNLEFSLDLRCIAAPVFDRNGDVVCAIGMSAPALRFPEKDVPAVAAMVVREASLMSRELGYRDTPLEPAASRAEAG
jgi:IclR family transcriptional regulator, KDG regulon repressor